MAQFNRLLIGCTAVALWVGAESCGSPVDAQTQGPPGPAGVSGYVVVFSQISLTPLTTQTTTSQCPTGKTAIAAGFSMPDGVYVSESRPGRTIGQVPNSTEQGTWTFGFRNANGTSTPSNVDMYVICALAS